MIENAIIKALNSSCPFTKSEVRSKLPTWWLDDFQAEKTKVSKLAQKAYRSNLSEDWQNYKVAKKDFKYKIRKSKRSSWINFCSQIETPKQISRFKKIIEKQDNKKMGLLKNASGGFCKAPDEVNKILLDTHVPGSTEQPHEADDLLDPSRICTQKEVDNSFVTEEKIKLSFSSFGSYKATNDAIKPICLKNLNDALIKRLKNLYNACLVLQYTPKSLRLSKLIFIPKPNKHDYSLVSSWRPITLTSFIFKALERIVLWHIEKYVLINNPISSRQHAFKAMHDVNTALSSLVSRIQSAILRDSYSLCIFLDIESAFPNVNFQSAINAWQNKQIPINLCNWYEQYLKKRYVSSEVLGFKTSRAIHKGIPQGGVLSSGITWNLIFDTLLDLFKGSSTWCLGYADDSSLCTNGKDLPCLIDLTEAALKKVVNWGMNNGLNFNPAKTNAIIFNKKLRLKMPRKVRMNNIELDYSSEVRYLGLDLDSKLNFNLHIQNKVKKAKRFLMLLKNNVGKMWGPPARSLLYAYNNMVIPSLGHGALVWYKSCQNASSNKKLAQLNRLIATCLMPLRYSTPTAGLQVVCNLMPVHLRMAELGLKTYLRVKNISKPIWDEIGTNNGKFGHLLMCKKDLSNLGITLVEEDRDNFLNIDRKYIVDLDSKRFGLPHYDSTLKCYTDGSRMNGKTGYGYIISDGDYIMKESNGFIGDNASVFQAEITAIQQACLELSKFEGDITIFTDSMSSVDALCKLKIKSKVVANCIQELNKLANGRKVTIHWIRAHTNDCCGNEYADAAAKAGTVSCNLVKTPIPTSFLKAKINKAFMNIWNQEWKSSTMFRQSKIFFPELKPKHSECLTRLGRYMLGQTVQLLVGHNMLNYHRHLICKDIDPLCRLCGEENEDSFHLIGECPVLFEKRAQIFHKYLLDKKPEWKVRQLVRMIKESCISGMLDGSVQDPEVE